MPLRTHVETALDELIAEEGAFKFQALSVVLAKQKWPRLIASERRYDLGLDALARGDLAPDGRGLGLACSLTPEFSKLAEDAAKVKKNYPDVQVLIFATPHGVTKHKEKQWAQVLSKDFGLDLVVMSREDLVTSLIDPSNADICRSQLGIHIEGKPELEPILSRVRAAIAEVLETWAERPRLSGRPLIDLDAKRVEEQRESHERMTIEDLRESLAEGRRIILEAPAGRGKTTTLLQIAGECNGMKFPLGKSKLDIGRGARNHISLNDPLASLKHCSITFEDDRCMVLDCGSEHGTFVNGFAFPAKFTAHGDHIRIGRSIFVYLLAGISPDAHRLLDAYGWPGNIRELETAIEWAISMGATPYIQPEDLLKEVRASSDSAASHGGTLYDREFDAFQKSLVERMLRETGRNRAEAARRLGWHPTSFRRRCGELGLE